MQGIPRSKLDVTNLGPFESGTSETPIFLRDENLPFPIPAPMVIRILREREPSGPTFSPRTSPVSLKRFTTLQFSGLAPPSTVEISF